MKLLLVFLFTSLSFASFTLPSGEYAQNGFHVSKQRIQEVVDTRYMSGLQRYEQLRGEGYNCAYAYNMIYRCVKFTASELSQSEVNKLKSIYKNSSLNFGYDYRVELVNDAPMLVEHDVFQQVDINIAGESTELKEYLSRQLSRLHKLKLKNDFEVIYEKNYDRLMLIHELRSRSGRANISKQVQVLFRK